MNTPQANRERTAARPAPECFFILSLVLFSDANRQNAGQ
jgi:hypothetical protein